MKNKYINEIFWLRAIACLSVVLIHAITSNRLHHPDSNMLWGLELFQLTLMFATPVFVFISEFLFARSYHDGLPKGFFKKRIKLLLFPYISIGIIFAIVFNDNLTFQSFLFKAFTNIFAGMFVAYFILIIFQFYILHYLFYKKLKEWNPWKVLFCSFIINIIYIGFFNFVPHPDNLLAEYIWKRGHWLLAIGWIFYFALGYYVGAYYEEVKKFITEHIALVLGFFLTTLAFLLFMHISGVLDVTSSKRIDIILYTTAVIFLIIGLSSLFKTVPKIVLFISNYSFNIYLLHRFTVSTIGPISNNDIINILALTIFGVIASIIMAKIINLLPFGKYIVGQPYKIKIKKENKLTNNTKGRAV